MLVMWTAMARYFGHSWISQFGTSEEPAFGTWSQALADYSPEQIARGVRNSSDAQMWNKDFPPNLPQFGKLCLTDKRIAEPYHRPLQIEHQPKKASKEVMERELERQRILRETGSLPDETFSESYRNCGLHQRWGELPRGRG